MNDRHLHPHPDADALQAFLDGGLPDRAARSVEEHLASCARCRSELAVWSGLFEELGALPRLAPHEGFQERVMAGLRPDPSAAAEGRLAALVARLRARLGGWLPTPAPRHPAPARLQEWLDGTLAAGAAGRVARHVDGCRHCAAEVSGTRTLFRELDHLDHLAPPADLADRVMAGLAAAPEAAPRRNPVLAWVRRRVPEARQAWAAATGVAVTPLATLGLIVYAVFSHPTLTPGALLSFVGWKLGDLAGLAWSAVAGPALESVGVMRLWALWQSLALTPGLVAAVLVTFSVCTVAALWVLYRNLFPTSAVDGSYVRASS